MDEKMERKNELANFEITPVSIERTKVTENLTKLPIDKLSSIGTAFDPLVAAFHSISGLGAGNSGLYHVNTKGLQMFKAKDSVGYIGGLKSATGSVGGGQAIMTPIPFDPATLCMAMALYSINQKLDVILEAQKAIIEFLEQKEKTALKADVSYLSDILSNYNYNWNNKQYKNSNYIKVLDIKQSSEQRIHFYREKIVKELEKKSFMQTDGKVSEKSAKIESDLEGYMLAAYLYAFSSFLEVMLLENFDADYLETVSIKIEDCEFRYRELYTQCCTQIGKLSETSLQSNLFKGMSMISRGAGKTVERIAPLEKAKLDEKLHSLSASLQGLNKSKTDKAMQSLADYQSASVQQFSENIRTVKQLYNEPIELLCDSENIYFGSNQ